MASLTGSDFKRLLEFVRGCYSASDLDGFAAGLLAGLPTVIPADITSFERMGAFPRELRYVVAPARADPPGAQDALRRHMHEHPFVPYYRRTRKGGAIKISDFLTKRQYHRLGIYNEFFRQAHPSVEDLMHVHVDGRLPSGIFVTVCRHSRDFTERDRLVLNLLRPHLLQANRNALAMMRVRRKLEQIGGALEAAGQGVIVLDHRGRIAMATARARALVEEYFHTPVHLRRLTGTLRDWVQRQLQFVGGIPRQGSPPAIAPLIVERKGKRLVIRLLIGEQRTTVLLEEQWLEIAPESLRALGLSRREAEVLALCAAGKTNVETGMLLAIRATTVAKHLERIFQKLGVETRTAAARRAFDFISAV